MKKILYVLIVTVVAMFMFNVDRADAVPSFARTMELPCEACHTNYPLLNSMGREFLRQGYDTGEEMGFNAKTSLQTPSPLGLVYYMRPIDKRFSSLSEAPLGSTDQDEQLKLRAAHEIEIFYTGRVGDFSYWAEIEGEDENVGGLGGMAVDIVMASVGWHPIPEFNIRTGVLQPYAPDGLNTITRVHGEPQAPWNGGGFTVGNAQSLILYGQRSNFIYSGAWHGQDTGDVTAWENNDAQNYSFRVAYEPPFIEVADVAIGGYFSHVEEAAWNANGTEASDKDRRNLWGFDAQLQYKTLQVNFLFGNRDYDSDDWASNNSDWGVSGAAQYFLQDADGLLTTGLSAYVDHYTAAFDTENYTFVGAYLTHFFRGNFKGIIGWNGSVEKPSRFIDSESRFRIQFVLGI